MPSAANPKDQRLKNVGCDNLLLKILSVPRKTESNWKGPKAHIRVIRHGVKGRKFCPFSSSLLIRSSCRIASLRCNASFNLENGSSLVTLPPDLGYAWDMNEVIKRTPPPHRKMPPVGGRECQHEWMYQEGGPANANNTGQHACENVAVVRDYHAPAPFRQYHPFVKQKFRAPIQNAPTSNTDCKPNNEGIEYLVESIDIEFSGGFYNSTISHISASDGGWTGLIYDVMI
jgi:hypothetical protein